MNKEQKISYSFLNEDVEFEKDILEKNKNVFVIAGGGERVVSMFLKSPKKIYINDIKKEQLFLAELKIETYRQLSYQDFLFFWDFFADKKDGKKRKEIFQSLNLRPELKEFFENIFEAKEWNSILYSGSWEKLFKKVGAWNNFITGNKIKKIFFLDQKNKIEYLKNKFPWKRFYFSLWLLGRAIIFNSLFYKGKFPKNNMNMSASRFYIEAFKRLFENMQEKKNYFLEFLFFGKILTLPDYLQEESFYQIKENIKKTEIYFLDGDFFDEIIKLDKVDFVSASDLISYLNEIEGKEFLKKIEKNISENGIVISRSYLNWQKVGKNNFQDISEKYQDKIEKEKTQMYQIKIYQKMI